MKVMKLLFAITLLVVVVLPQAIGTSVGSVVWAASTAPAALIPNDMTQARLRVSQCVYKEPEMEVQLNGKVPVVADVPLTVQQGDVTRYEYLAPGTHSLAVIPVGQDVSRALLRPLDVTVAAGHRYTVVVLGQKDEASHKALVIDETAAYQAIGAKPTDAAHITVNNLRGAESIDFQPGLVSRGVTRYGEFTAATYPAGPFKGFAVTITDASGKGFVDRNDDEGYMAPAFDTLDCFGGIYPGTPGADYDTHTSASTSLLNGVDYLQALSDEAARSGGTALTNKTFLAALRTTGLSDMLTQGGPYMVFAPTDEAFAALGKDKLDALMADRQALTNLLRRHIVQGYYPQATLITGHYEHRFDRTVTNMLGEKLTLLTNDDGAFINGDNVGSFENTIVANGTRIFPYLDKVLLLAPPAPGMPTTGAGANDGPLFVDLTVSISAMLALALLVVGSLLQYTARQR